MTSKQSSSRISTLASKGLRGEKLTQKEQKSVYASALSQDEKKGQGKSKKH